MLLYALALLAQEGSAIFDAPLVAAGPRQRFEVLLDLNGDGWQDAVSAWWENSAYSTLRITGFYNDHSGKLVETWLVSTPAGSGTQTTVFEGGACDFDWDGRDDFWIVVHGVSDRILAFASNGDMPAIPHATFGWVGGDTAQPVFRDFDADGYVDRALAEDLSLRLQRMDTSGAGLLDTSALALPGIADHTFACDANGDATPDVAVNVGGTLLLVPVVGNAFGTPTVLAHGLSAMPMPMSGDIDGDGDADFVVFDMHGYVVARRSGPATFDLEPYVLGGPAAKLADVDGDGDLDGICCGGGGPVVVYNSVPSTFRIALNDGTGHFDPAIEIPGLGSREIAGAADLDHDGDVDLVGGRCVYYSRGGIRSGIRREIAPRTQTPSSIGDWDRDGDLDFEIGMNTVFESPGDGATAQTYPLVSTPPAGCEFRGPGYPGDFDGDGDLDIVVGMRQNGTFASMRFLANDGGGAYVDRGDAGPVGVDFDLTGTGVEFPEGSYAADSDADGDIDLFTKTVSGSTYASRLWVNDGTGHFTPGPEFPNELVQFVGDLKWDWYYGPYYELVTTGAYQNIHPGIGVNQWLSGGWPSSTGPDLHRYTPAFVDFEGDGDLDRAYIYEGGYSSGLVLERFESSGAWTNEFYFELDYVIPGTPLRPRRISTGDVNGDGLVDIVVPCPRFGWPAIAIVLRNATNTGFSTPIQQVIYPESGGVVATEGCVLADIDGDGDIDLLSSGWIDNKLFDGPAAGHRVQIGVPIPDENGRAPKLGASGPFRVGESAKIQLSGIPAGRVGIMIASWASDPGSPGTGPLAALRASVIVAMINVTTVTASNDPYGGRWELPYTVPGYAAGRTKNYEVRFPDDVGLGGCVTSNRLQITYGP